MMSQKISNERVDDRSIESAVRSVNVSLPETLDQKVTAALRAKDKKPRLWYPLATAAALLLAAVMVFIFQPFSGTTVETDTPAPITEIKTELTLSHANIKILWVQKKDFKLRR
jgi:hypothetical protein